VIVRMIVIVIVRAGSVGSGHRYTST
jgi:hypothetical protein